MAATRVWVLAVVGVSAAIGAGAHLLHAPEPVLAASIDDGAQLVAGAAATLSCLWFGRRAQAGERLWRWLMAAGFAGWTVGMAFWSWYQVFGGVALPSPSIADVGYLTLPCFALAALLVLVVKDQPRRQRSRWLTDGHLSRAVMLLDGLVVVGSLFILAWTMVLGVVVRAGAPTPAAFAVAIAYPLSDLLLVTIVVLLVVFGAAPQRHRNRLLVIGLGLVALSISDSIFAYLVSTGADEMPPILNIGFIAGPALIAVAARNTSTASAQFKLAPGRELAHLMLPYVPFAVTCVVIAVQIRRNVPMDAVEIYVGGIVIALVVVRQFITLLENRRLLERVKESQARLEYQAYHDPLTGLANRALFHEHLMRAVERHRSSHARLGLLFIDLDDFKLVNDSLGHATGDTILRGIAERLRASCSDGEVVARLGGDEFAVLLHEREPREVATRLLHVMRQPFTVAGRKITISASIGAVVTGPPERNLTADALLRRVDAAMYEGKKAGKGLLVVFDGDKVGLAHPDLPTMLAAALHGEPQAGAIDVHYQPIVRLGDGAIIAVEALARWTNPLLGPIPAELFVAAAEGSGLIAELDQRMLDMVCRDLAAVGPGRPPRVHVNISASRLGCPELEASVHETLRRYAVSGTHLVLEITETSQIQDLTAAVESARRLCKDGIKLALDDFGTGYNSLAVLHALPVDVVKLDRSLTAASGEYDRTEKLGRSVLSICESMGITVVAEGVETREQVDRLVSWGCQFGQGYLYGRSGPLAELAAGPVSPVEVPRKSLQ